MFIPNTPEEKKAMLARIGVSSVRELFAAVDKRFLYPKLNLPAALDEQALSAHLRGLAAKNKPLQNFIGAGYYEHFIPAAVNALSGRGEFLTAYTPYQAEASQGTLQAIYEFQSCICALFEMAVCSASHYDGATAMAEAVAGCLRVNNKPTVLISAALHPHYKQVLRTYLRHMKNVTIEEVACPNGTLDLNELKKQLTPGVSCFVLADPNFLGCLEDAPAVAAAVHSVGALLVSVVNPTALGTLRTPGSYDADFAVAEGQSLGNALQFGGPGLGIFTCKQQFLRQVPGRIAGIALDKNGNRSFVLTLQAREQHIRREKAASNICSNQALCALNAVIYLTLLGPEGIKEIAELNLEKAHLLKDELEKEGFTLKFTAPFYNEFVLELNQPAAQVIKKMARKGIAAGYDLGQIDPSLANCLLICVTETKTAKDLKHYVAALKEAHQ